MTETTPLLRPLWRQLTWWTLAFPVVMIVTIARHDIYLLKWIHVLSGALWTGADLFMGFILGPTLRMLDMSARTALIAYLVPRTLVLPHGLPNRGYRRLVPRRLVRLHDISEPHVLLVVISLALVAVMTVMGLGFLLPNSLRIWRELRRPEPDRERIVHLNRINIWLAGMQGLMQIAIILVMAKYVS
jgi:hypothetical protein